MNNVGRRERIEDFFVIEKMLGSGSFSEVKLCRDKTSSAEYAVKIVSKTGKSEAERRMENIMCEINILKAVNHTNIVQLKDIFEDDTHIYIIMENISGGELFEKIVELTHYSEKEASKIISQILAGVEHLHSRGIVHRDLKPENLLLSNPTRESDIKITDFGLSEIFAPGVPMRMSRAVGTPGYIAPEVLEFLETGDPYGPEVDLWSVGVILYILLCGFPPFHGETDDDIYDKICAGQWKFISPYWDNISTDAKDLISHLLVLNPYKRFTAQQALNHPWILENEKNSADHLKYALIELKKFNARRKLKGVFLAVKALSKFKTVFAKVSSPTQACPKTPSDAAQ